MEAAEKRGQIRKFQKNFFVSDIWVEDRISVGLRIVLFCLFENQTVRKVIFQLHSDYFPYLCPLFRIITVLVVQKPFCWTFGEMPLFSESMLVLFIIFVISHSKSGCHVVNMALVEKKKIRFQPQEWLGQRVVAKNAKNGRLGNRTHFWP